MRRRRTTPARFPHSVRSGGLLALAFEHWEKLAPRLKAIFSDDLSGRVEIYRNAEQMARDFPAYGTGPGTFPWVYHLYRAHAQADLTYFANSPDSLFDAMFVCSCSWFPPDEKRAEPCHGHAPRTATEIAIRAAVLHQCP